MTKWKSVQIKDEGEVVEDIIDPEAHKEIKRLKEVAVGLKEELDKSHEHQNETCDMLRATQSLVERLEAEIDEKNTKISCLATKMNDLLIHEGKLNSRIKKLDREMDDRRMLSSDVVEQYRTIRDQLELVQSEIAKYKTMEEKARSENYDKEFIRKLRQLLRSL